MTTAGSPSAPYQQLIDHALQAHLLRSTAGLLSWDQEVMMPRAGVEHRSQQYALLAKLIHEMAVDPRVGEWLADCESDGDLTADPLSPAAVNVRELRRSHDKALKLPAELVEQLAATSTQARAYWLEAREQNDFELFRPWLAKVVDLTRRKADCFGWPDAGEPWDALADAYQADLSAAAVSAVFGPLRDRLVRLNEDLLGHGKAPDNCFAKMTLREAPMRRFVRYVAERLGFEFDRGRLDTSAHPFCTTLAPNDVRMTTRFGESNPIEPLFSTMHETGHGIYNLGLPAEHAGTPMGSSVSLSIHESQSRLWENQVGRSRAFWSWCLPKMRRFFGVAAASLSLDAVYAGANLVQPQCIRVEADEATYNLHIIVRFELERALINADLEVSDLPEAWADQYRQTLGIEVSDDARGCLQDIHWSQGAIGYFPTYTLGNLYAAQFFEAARRDNGALDEQFAAGRFADLRAWLRHNIHDQGMRYRTAELCEHVTGEPLSIEPLMRHLEGKLRPVYGV